jgi:SAM-dependent methyltransferase
VSADERIDSVFHAPSRAALTQTYDEWAASYDADMQSTGYVHPPICVGLVARYIKDKSATILDAGVGTGTIGQLLNIMGYANLIGIDMSDGMLAVAASRNIYTDLRNQILGEPLSFDTASIDCLVSTGTFTTGHAPASAFDELVRIVRPNGYFIFTVGTAVWEGAGFAAKIKSLPVTEIETTKIYHPMPLSKTESGFTARAHVYQRT